MPTAPVPPYARFDFVRVKGISTYFPGPADTIDPDVGGLRSALADLGIGYSIASPTTATSSRPETKPALQPSAIGRTSIVPEEFLRGKSDYLGTRVASRAGMYVAHARVRTKAIVVKSLTKAGEALP